MNYPLEVIKEKSHLKYLEQIEIYVTRVLTHEISDKLVYHNLEHTHRIVSAIMEIGQEEQFDEEEMSLCLKAGWLLNVGYAKIEDYKDIHHPKELFQKCNDRSVIVARQFLSSIAYPSEELNRVVELIKECGPNVNDRSILAKVLVDAMHIDWAKPKAKRLLKNLYEEFLLVGFISFGKGTWYEEVLSHLYEHKYLTDYGRVYLEPLKIQLIRKIKKDQKELEKTERSLIKRELDISDEELKKLKKKLNSVKGRDDRGIQTMFRTTSRNHYTLYQMVDRKANIMISINAILLSLIMGRIIGQIDTFCIHNSPILIMLSASLISIILAILAITPTKTHGKFTEQEIRDKRGNLLYFGNFHNMNFRDYQWGMLQMLNDHNFLYESMIQDLYFLGKILDKKSKLIRGSLSIFMFGLAMAVIAFLVVSSMEDFHFGNSPHL